MAWWVKGLGAWRSATKLISVPGKRSALTSNLNFKLARETYRNMNVNETSAAVSQSLGWTTRLLSCTATSTKSSTTILSLSRAAPSVVRLTATKWVRGHSSSASTLFWKAAKSEATPGGKTLGGSRSVFRHRFASWGRTGTVNKAREETASKVATGKARDTSLYQIRRFSKSAGGGGGGADTSGEKEPESHMSKFKKMIRKYGPLFIGFYLSLYLTTLGTLFVCFEYGVFSPRTKQKIIELKDQYDEFLKKVRVFVF